MSQWHDVFSTEQLKPGQHEVLEINQKTVAIFNLAGDFVAIEDFCTHQGLPLSGGDIEGNEIECPYHGARFCLKTGKVTCPPAMENLTTFPIKIEEGKVKVLL